MNSFFFPFSFLSRSKVYIVCDSSFPCPTISTFPFKCVTYKHLFSLFPFTLLSSISFWSELLLFNIFQYQNPYAKNHSASLFLFLVVLFSLQWDSCYFYPFCNHLAPELYFIFHFKTLPLCYLLLSSLPFLKFCPYILGKVLFREKSLPTSIPAYNIWNFLGDVAFLSTFIH